MDHHQKQFERRMAKLRCDNPELLSPLPAVYRKATGHLLKRVTPSILQQVNDQSLLILQREIEEAIAAGMSDEEIDAFVTSFEWKVWAIGGEFERWRQSKAVAAPKDNVVHLHVTRTG